MSEIARSVVAVEVFVDARHRNQLGVETPEDQGTQDLEEAGGLVENEAAPELNATLPIIEIDGSTSEAEDMGLGRSATLGLPATLESSSVELLPADASESAPQSGDHSLTNPYRANSIDDIAVTSHLLRTMPA